MAVFEVWAVLAMDRFLTQREFNARLKALDEELADRGHAYGFNDRFEVAVALDGADGGAAIAWWFREIEPTLVRHGLGPPDARYRGDIEARPIGFSYWAGSGDVYRMQGPSRHRKPGAELSLPGDRLDHGTWRPVPLIPMDVHEIPAEEAARCGAPEFAEALAARGGAWTRRSSGRDIRLWIVRDHPGRPPFLLRSVDDRDLTPLERPLADRWIAVMGVARGLDLMDAVEVSEDEARRRGFELPDPS
jgi:hypothetical protein